MSVRQAKRACPDAAVLRADYPSYDQVSEQFLDILAQYTPLLEPDSYGSAYMDVTASRALFGDALEIGKRIVSEVSTCLDMPICVGCASNKLTAKAAATQIRNPHPEPRRRHPEQCRRVPICNVPLGSEHEFLAPLPVGVLDAVTKKIEKRLRELGVSTIGQLARIPGRLLVKQFGPVGEVLIRQSNGVDSSPVKAAYPPEVIITEHTFYSPIEEPPEIEKHLRAVATDLSLKLKKRCLLAGKIGLRLQGDFQLSTFNFQLKKPTESAYTILQALLKLLYAAMKPGMEVSGVRVVLSELERGADFQLSFLGESERKRRLDSVIEQITERFGDGSICFAGAISCQLIAESQWK